MIKIRDKYLISVIIPFVNYDKNLIEIINNIKNRKNLNFLELILLNDSKKKISKKKLKLNNNMVFRNINSFSGPGIARNEGIKISKGKWIMFLTLMIELILIGLLKLKIIY